MSELRTADLRARVGEIEWYHTLELAPEIVTPGWFDTRAVLARLPMPASLEGRRCLDIGTFDGFWAFEMERRGAAEVIAIDVLDPSGWDWPANSTAEVAAALDRRKARGVGFELAHEVFGSAVQRLERSVYELDPAQDGLYDFIYLGSLLLHLRDPVGALMRARSVCAGELLVVDAVQALPLPWRGAAARLDGVGRPWWWKPNVAGLAAMVRAAGMEPEGRPRRVLMRPGAGQRRTPLTPATLARRAGREAALASWLGDPHAAILARPS